VNSPRRFPGSGPREHEIEAKSLLARIEDEARRDAAAYHREFQRAYGHDGLDWLAEAWADLNRDLELTADQASRLWMPYWTAFNEETLKLASKNQSGH
jgi:hypothetical protein